MNFFFIFNFKFFNVRGKTVWLLSWICIFQLQEEKQNLRGKTSEREDVTEGFSYVQQMETSSCFSFAFFPPDVGIAAPP